MEFTEKKIETLFIIAMVASVMWCVTGVANNHQIEHPFPYTYYATDGFAYLLLTEYLYYGGNQRYHPYYETMGYGDVLWIHGLTIYSVSAIFAHTAGITPYDALGFMEGLFVILTALIIYVITRQYNKNVAMIGSAFFVIFATKNFYITYLWGEMGAVSGMAFMLMMVWCILRIDLENTPILIALFSIATIFTHLPEFLFGGLFIAAWYAVKTLIDRKIDWNVFKTLAIGMIAAMLIASYYIALFIFTFESQKGAIVSPKEFTILRVALFPELGYPFIILMFLGLAYALYDLFTNKKIKIAPFMAMIFLLIGFSNYFGLGYRAFHIRAYWPFFLAPLVGIAVYLGLKMIMKKIEPMHAVGITAIMFAILVYAYYTPMPGPGALDQDRYDSMKWIRENTGPADKIFLLYGDGYSQSGRYIPRLTYNINMDDYFGSLREGQITRQYRAELFTLAGGDLFYWKDTLTPGYHLREENLTWTRPIDLCAFEYYLIDKTSRYVPQVGQANLYIAQLFKNNGMTTMYENGETVILKNNDVGGNCIAQNSTSIASENTTA